MEPSKQWHVAITTVALRNKLGESPERAHGGTFQMGPISHGERDRDPDPEKSKAAKAEDFLPVAWLAWLGAALCRS